MKNTKLLHKFLSRANAKYQKLQKEQAQDNLSRIRPSQLLRQSPRWTQQPKAKPSQFTKRQDQGQNPSNLDKDTI